MPLSSEQSYRPWDEARDALKGTLARFVAAFETGMRFGGPEPNEIDVDAAQSMLRLKRPGSSRERLKNTAHTWRRTALSAE